MKKKLLIIITPLKGRGGTIRRLKLWARYLSEHYQIKIMCHTADYEVVKTLEEKGAMVLNDGSLSQWGRVTVLPGLLAIHREVKAYSPDLIISMFLWSDFLTSVLLRLRKLNNSRSIPHLVHIAGDPVPHLINPLKQRVYRRMMIYLLRTPERIITISGWDAQMLAVKYSAEKSKSVVIPIGIALMPFTERKEPHVPFTFGVVSRLYPVKNVETIIRVFKAVIAEVDIPARLEIFGDGISRRGLEDLVTESGLTGNVSFHGWVGDPGYAFDRIDCILLFSNTEGTPRAILEAAERGVAAIANKVGGIKEIIDDGKTGYMVQTEEELKEKMIYLLSGKRGDVLNMGMEARRFMEKRHSIEAETARLRDLIEELTSN